MSSELEVGAAAGQVIGTIQNNHQLEPRMWFKEELDEKVLKALTLTAFKFIKSWDLSDDVPIKDIIITGSTASYNWTSESDIDLHIVVDLASLHSNSEALAKYLNAKAAIWNAQHNISIFGHPVELYVQDIREPHVSAGVYSLLSQSWIQRPTMVSGDNVDANQIYQLVDKYANSIDLLEVLYNRGQYDQVIQGTEQLRAYIKKRRAESLHGEGGLVSTFNLVFKVLRKSGLLEKLSDLHIKAYDSMMSIQEQPKERSLEEVWSLLSHPETGFASRTPAQQEKLLETLTKVLVNAALEEDQRQTIVSYLRQNSTLKSNLKAIVYDLLEEGALGEYAEVIAEGKLMSFHDLGTKGNLVEKLSEYYKSYPNLSKRSFLEGIIHITGATGNVNIGKGEVALALLCKDVMPSTSAEGDMIVEGKSIEIKGSDARAISQKSGYRENSDKVILQSLSSQFNIEVATGMRFTHKLSEAFKQHIAHNPSDPDHTTSFLMALDELLTSVYRGVNKVPKLILESGQANSQYVKKVEDTLLLDGAALEKDLATILLEDYINHHTFDKWFYFNAKTYNYFLVGREEVLQEASTSPSSPIFLYVRDGTVRMTYTEQIAPKRIGYHASFKSDTSHLAPSETIEDASLAAKHQSKVGFLGTGLFFFGDKEAAVEYGGFMDTRVDRDGAQVYPVDLSQLKLYQPSKPEEFVNDLRVTTINLYHLQGEDLKEEIREAAKDLTKYTHLTEKQLSVLLAKFAKDIKNPSAASDKTQLSNRLLPKYDGIDLTGSSKDHFGTGSVIFPKAIQKAVSTI